MLNNANLELIRIGKKLKNIIIYDIYDTIDSFEFYRAKFYNNQYKNYIILHNLNRKNGIS